jgi:hypothetical protein
MGAVADHSTSCISCIFMQGNGPDQLKSRTSGRAGRYSTLNRGALLILWNPYSNVLLVE